MMPRNAKVVRNRYPKSAKAVKRIRKASGLSQAEFADARGINLRTLQGWEAGYFRPNEDGIKKLHAR